MFGLLFLYIWFSWRKSNISIFAADDKAVLFTGIFWRAAVIHPIHVKTNKQEFILKLPMLFWGYKELG